MNKVRLRRSAIGALACAALLFAACGSDDDDGGGTGSSDTTSSDTETTDTTEAAAADLGEPNAATGEPILIGHIGEGATDALDNTAENDGVDAAVAYANEYLGGIGGRPIEIERCETGGTPTGAQECVSQMIDAGVAAVVNGVSGQVGTFGPALGEAGIAMVEMGGLDQAVLGAPNNYIIGNGLGTALAGPAAVAAANGISKAGVIVIDVPAASGPISAIGPTFYENAGVELEIVTVAPGTADMSPQVQSAISAGVEQFSIIGDETFCASALQAFQTLGYTGDVVVIAQCISEDTAALLEGQTLLTASSSNTSDPEVALFQAVMDEYAPDASQDSVAQGGYGAVLSLVRATATLTAGAEVSAATIADAISTMAPAQLPLAPDGVEFQCGAGIISFAPAICSGSVLQTTLDAEGNGTEFTELDTSEITVLG